MRENMLSYPVMAARNANHVRLLLLRCLSSSTGQHPAPAAAAAPPPAVNLCALTLLEAAEALRSGQVAGGPTGLIEACSQRMLQQQHLNAFTATTVETALLQHEAAALEARSNGSSGVGSSGGGGSGSVLRGIPIAVKDNFCTEGIASTAASAMLGGYVPPLTATVVRRLLHPPLPQGGGQEGETHRVAAAAAASCGTDTRGGSSSSSSSSSGSSGGGSGSSANAGGGSSSSSSRGRGGGGGGAVLMGRTNMDEFGMGSFTTYSSYGPTVSPWASTDSLAQEPRAAGGSSGGSAAAVASGMVFAALGSDTGGSLRLPAAYCGVVGYKPTYGLLSRYGLIAYCSSLDCPGVITRSVADAAVLTAAMQGQDERDGTSRAALPGLTALLQRADASPLAAQREAGQLLLHAAGKGWGSGPGSASGPGPGSGPGSRPGPGSSSEEDQDLPLRGVHVGVPLEYHVEELSDAVQEAWERGIAWLQRAGASVRTVSLPHTKAAIGAYYVIASAESSSNLARYDGLRYGGGGGTHPRQGTKLQQREEEEEGEGGDGGGGPREEQGGGGGALRALAKQTRTQGFGPEVQRRLMAGTFGLSSQHAARYYLKALKVRRRVDDDFRAAFGPCTGQGGGSSLPPLDCLVMPVAPGVAPTLRQAQALGPAESYAGDVMTVAPSLAGLPAISVPVGLDSSSGLPLALQLVAPRWHDVALLALGCELERQRDLEAAAAAAGGGGTGGGSGGGNMLPWQGCLPLYQ